MADLVPDERYEYDDLLNIMRCKVFPAAITHTFWLFGAMRKALSPRFFM